MKTKLFFAFFLFFSLFCLGVLPAGAAEEADSVTLTLESPEAALSQEFHFPAGTSVTLPCCLVDEQHAIACSTPVWLSDTQETYLAGDALVLTGDMCLSADDFAEGYESSYALFAVRGADGLFCFYQPFTTDKSEGGVALRAYLEEDASQENTILLFEDMIIPEFVRLGAGGLNLDLNGHCITYTGQGEYFLFGYDSIRQGDTDAHYRIFSSVDGARLSLDTTTRGCALFRCDSRMDVVIDARHISFRGNRILRGCGQGNVHIEGGDWHLVPSEDDSRFSAIRNDGAHVRVDNARVVCDVIPVQPLPASAARSRVRRAPLSLPDPNFDQNALPEMSGTTLFYDCEFVSSDTVALGNIAALSAGAVELTDCRFCHVNPADGSCPGAVITCADGATLYSSVQDAPQDADILHCRREYTVHIGEKPYTYVYTAMQVPPQSPIAYTTVVWRNENGTVVATEKWEAGTAPVYEQQIHPYFSYVGSAQPGDTQGVLSLHATSPNPSLQGSLSLYTGIRFHLFLDEAVYAGIADDNGDMLPLQDYPAVPAGDIILRKIPLRVMNPVEAASLLRFTVYVKIQQQILPYTLCTSVAAYADVLLRDSTLPQEKQLALEMLCYIRAAAAYFATEDAPLCEQDAAVLDTVIGHYEAAGFTHEVWEEAPGAGDTPHGGGIVSAATLFLGQTPGIALRMADGFDADIAMSYSDENGVWRQTDCVALTDPESGARYLVVCLPVYCLGGGILLRSGSTRVYYSPALYLSAAKETPALEHLTESLLSYIHAAQLFRQQQLPHG